MATPCFVLSSKSSEKPLWQYIITIIYNEILCDFCFATMWHIDNISWWCYIMKLYDDIMILYDDEMSWGHGDGYVVLRTLMDEPVIKASYRETMIHSIEIAWEMLARKEWLRCCHDVSPMFDIPRSTPVLALYMIFFWFSWYKNLYVLCFKIYMYYKRNTGGL